MVGRHGMRQEQVQSRRRHVIGKLVLWIQLKDTYLYGSVVHCTSIQRGCVCVCVCVC
jgi:hypothetical protein